MKQLLSIASADFGTAVCFANKYYPGIIPLDNAFKALVGGE